jgi:hypothetical protein
VQVTGNFVEYRGRELAESFAGDDWLAVDDDGGDFPDEVGRGEGRRGPWVKLPKESLSRRWHQTVRGRWRDGEVVVERADSPDRRLLGWLGGPEGARERGLAGDQHQGWTTVVPVDEVEVTDVEIEEMA